MPANPQMEALGMIELTAAKILPSLARLQP